LPSEIHKVDKSLYTIQDFREWNPPPIRHIIWEGVLDIGQKLQIFGNEGSWKSILALHLAYCLSSGHKWLGFRTSPANVIYIVGEGGKLSIRNRAIKYCNGTRTIYLAKPGDVPQELERAEALASPDNVAMQYIDTLHLDGRTGGINILRDKVDKLIACSPALPVVVIVDPLYKVVMRDLTVAREVSFLLENLDCMLADYNSVRNGYQLQLAVVIVHHPRKASIDKEGNKIFQGSDDSFGAKELSWWFDTVMNANLNEEDATKTIVDVRFTKHGRDAEGYLPELIKVRWDKSTLHPRILKRLIPKLPDDELELRGDTLLQSLE